MLVFGAIVEVVCAEILVDGSGLEQIVSGGEHGGGYGSDVLLGAAAAAQAVGIGPGSSCPWCERPPRSADSVELDSSPTISNFQTGNRVQEKVDRTTIGWRTQGWRATVAENCSIASKSRWRSLSSFPRRGCRIAPWLDGLIDDFLKSWIPIEPLA